MKYKKDEKIEVYSSGVWVKAKFVRYTDMKGNVVEIEADGNKYFVYFNCIKHLGELGNPNIEFKQNKRRYNP